MPVNCACGTSFSVQHALSCPKGGYPSIRHNEVRDLTAELLTEVCSGVATEPMLQPVSSERFHRVSTNTQVGARLDIVANGFWCVKFERAFFDVRVFNHFSPSNRKSLLSSVYRQHEKVKKRHYEQRIQEIEHSSFTPLVFSSTGGMGHITTVFLQTVGIATSCKVGGTLFYDHGLAPLQAFIFPLTCFHNVHSRARSSIHHYERQPLDVIIQEARLSV